MNELERRRTGRMRVVALLVGVVLQVLLLSRLGNASIVGSIDEPIAVASGVGTIRGWVYSTSGAEIISPMEVFVDDVLIATTVCCTSRGDVPVRQSGFASQFNWALLTPGPHQMRILAQSSSGESTVLTASFASVRTDEVKFAGSWEFSDSTKCYFSNHSGSGGNARFRCTNVLVTSDGQVRECGGSIAFDWDVGSQSFKQASGCE